MATAETRERLRSRILDTGAAAVGFAAAAPLPADARERFSQWIANGRHGNMDYMSRHEPLVADPATVLEGVRTVISIAYPYYPPVRRDPQLPRIALYAYGRDYHKTIRSRLRALCREVEAEFDAATRICADTAPVAERYWAMRSGIGRLGRNGCIIIDGHGSYVFLSEILTSLSLPPNEPSTRTCLDCGACQRACPGNAIQPDGTVDSRLCLSYLTIEHRGKMTAEQSRVMQSPDGRATLYGCDICQKVCPHNRDVPPTTIADFSPRLGMLTIDAADIAAMSEEQWDEFTRGSAMRRADFAALRRHANLAMKQQVAKPKKNI